MTDGGASLLGWIFLDNPCNFSNSTFNFLFFFKYYISHRMTHDSFEWKGSIWQNYVSLIISVYHKHMKFVLSHKNGQSPCTLNQYQNYQFSLITHLRSEIGSLLQFIYWIHIHFRMLLPSVEIRLTTNEPFEGKSHVLAAWLAKRFWNCYEDTLFNGPMLKVTIVVPAITTCPPV